MASQIPSLSELYNQLINDIKFKLNLTKALGRLFFVPLAKVYSAILKTIYIALNRVERNLYPDTSDTFNLIRAGLIRLNRKPFSAIQGQYNCEVNGMAGAVIDADQRFVTDDGRLYILDVAYTLPSETGEINIRALDAGPVGELSVDDILEPVSPIPDVNSEIIVLSETVAPTEGEDIEDYREDVVNSYRLQPQGGSRADFKIWSTEVPGIRDAYPYTRKGSPTMIDLYLEAVPSDSTDGLGTPPQSLLDAVLNNIEPELEPMGIAEIYYLPIIPTYVDVAVTGLGNPAFESSIRASIEDVLFDIRPYIPGADAQVNSDKGELVYSDVYDAVRSVTNDFDNVTVSVKGNEITKYVFEGAEIPFLNDLFV